VTGPRRRRSAVGFQSHRNVLKCKSICCAECQTEFLLTSVTVKLRDCNLVRQCVARSGRVSGLVVLHAIADLLMARAAGECRSVWEPSGNPSTERGDIPDLDAGHGFKFVPE